MVSAVAFIKVPVLPLSTITLVLLLVHIPPLVASDMVTAPPACDILVGPLIAVIMGIAFTVITCVTIHIPAVVLLKVMVAVPTPSPVMSAPEAIAIVVLLLVHPPAEDAVDRSVTAPTHILKLPCIGNGLA